MFLAKVQTFELGTQSMPGRTKKITRRCLERVNPRLPKARWVSQGRAHPTGSQRPPASFSSRKVQPRLHPNHSARGNGSLPSPVPLTTPHPQPLQMLPTQESTSTSEESLLRFSASYSSSFTPTATATLESETLTFILITAPPNGRPRAGLLMGFW